MTLKAGDNAYLDTFNGLVPCRVLSILKTETGYDIKAIITRTIPMPFVPSVPLYRKGEIIETKHPWCVPRNAVRYRKYGIRISKFQVQPDTEEKYLAYPITLPTHYGPYTTKIDPRKYTEKAWWTFPLRSDA